MMIVMVIILKCIYLHVETKKDLRYKGNDDHVEDDDSDGDEYVF